MENYLKGGTINFVLGAETTKDSSDYRGGLNGYSYKAETTIVKYWFTKDFFLNKKTIQGKCKRWDLVFRKSPNSLERPNATAPSLFLAKRRYWLKR